jgi:signal peptidase
MNRRQLLGLALTFAVVAVWAVVLRPTALGGPASYIFVSGVSMEPTLETGDLVVLQASDDYATGDIIAFRVPDGSPGAGSLVIHRIVGGSPDVGFVMQGDNKPAPDEWRPTGDLVAGRIWLHVPGAGAIVAWLRQPAVFASLAAGLVVFLIVLGGASARPPRAEIPADG